MRHAWGWVVIVGLVSTLTAAQARAQEGLQTGPARVDFDDRLVKGQRHGTGSVYIFERQKVEMKSMVKKPHSFRNRIIVTVFPQ